MDPLYEDRDLLAVNKPPGVVVIPSRNAPPEDSLHHRLQALRGERLWVAHRIDRETSGVVVFARSADAHRRLNDLFASRRVEKSYVAFAAGAALPDAQTVAIALHPARKGKMRPAREGEPGALDAVTELRVLARWRLGPTCVSRVVASPRTGRQHQIRVHLRALDAPLVMDPLYARPLPVSLPALARMALHAASLRLSWLGAPRVFVAPLPDDLERFARALGEPDAPSTEPSSP